MATPVFMMVEPSHFSVAYAINPWMSPEHWQRDGDALHRHAVASSASLARILRAAGGRIEMLPGVSGAPDLVFPANAAVVLDGRAILARFAHPERQVEEPIFARAFEDLRQRGVLETVAELPAGCVQEGAGDFIWDASRALFWAGHGPRSSLEGLVAVGDFFGKDVVALELATARFYHLDTCFCPLPGGEVFYYPSAFTPDAQREIIERVDHTLRIEASDEDAARFCVNAVALNKTLVMAEPTAGLRDRLAERGYQVEGVDLRPFIMSGGGAYCMTLRLDRSS